MCVCACFIAETVAMQSILFRDCSVDADDTAAVIDAGGAGIVAAVAAAADADVRQ